MSHILQTSFENGKLNDSNGLQNKLSLIVEFSLFHRKIETKVLSTSPGITIFFGVLLLIMETFGNFLLFCMVWYEKFGMDSKKRTITNQLLSRWILALIFFNILFMPLFFGAFLTPYGEYFQKSYHKMKAQLDYFFLYHRFLSFALLFSKVFEQISIHVTL